MTTIITTANVDIVPLKYDDDAYLERITQQKPKTVFHVYK
jgi:hypothetical protein